MDRCEKTDFLIIDRSFYNMGLLPRTRYNKPVQFLFDLIVHDEPRFDKLFNSKGNTVIIYDASDEIITLPCSSFVGALALFHGKLNALATKTPYPSSISHSNTVSKMLETFRRTSRDFEVPERMFADIAPIMPEKRLKELYQRMTAIFEFVKSVDLNARMDESQTIRRTSTMRLSSQVIISHVSDVLKLNATSNSNIVRYSYKDDSMRNAFNQESNGLSEIIVKFVRFMHRLDVCTLSAFDLFCPKTHDERMLKVFLWAFWFMHRSSEVRSDSLSTVGKFNPIQIQKGSVKSS